MRDFRSRLAASNQLEGIFGEIILRLADYLTTSEQHISNERESQKGRGACLVFAATFYVLESE